LSLNADASLSHQLQYLCGIEDIDWLKIKVSMAYIAMQLYAGHIYRSKRSLGIVCTACINLSSRILSLDDCSMRTPQ